MVAYFSLPDGSNATKGTSDYAAEYGNYSFFFASAANRDAFVHDPESFVPQWGGFCSYGISEENWWTWSEIKEAGPSSNPNVWKVIDGKLYVFMYEEPFQKFMAGDITGQIIRGNLRWTNWTQGKKFFNTNCPWWSMDCGRFSDDCV